MWEAGEAQQTAGRSMKAQGRLSRVYNHASHMSPLSSASAPSRASHAGLDLSKHPIHSFSGGSPICTLLHEKPLNPRKLHMLYVGRRLITGSRPHGHKAKASTCWQQPFWLKFPRMTEDTNTEHYSRSVKMEIQLHQHILHK